ncbi:MAG: PHP domain-containing protein, partial [Clostridia bacterium]|nr:PHP domain-containing protein [Clostridia bacterium]
MKLDMHVHGENSFDSVQTLDDIAKACRAKGLDGVCICDHNVTSHKSITVYDGILIVPGVEIATDHGHLLGFCVESSVEPTRDFFEARERIKRANGLAVLAHPYERVRDTRETVDKRIAEVFSLLDGLEAANARADQFVREANTYARSAAMINRMRTFGGSDAHLPCEIGGAYTEIEVDSESINALTLDMLREAFLTNGATAVLKARSKRINTAKSQFIRIKKINADT